MNSEMITEIDYNKYLVLKIEDLDKYFSQFTKGVFTTKTESKYINQLPFNTVLNAIKTQRENEGKKDNKYLVLNIDDEISINYLIETLQKFKKLGRNDYYDIQIKRLAVDLINAILKLKS